MKSSSTPQQPGCEPDPTRGWRSAHARPISHLEAGEMGLASAQRSASSQALAAYLPMDRRLALADHADLPDRASGAALCADISGFTQLTEVLAHELGPQRGAEELTHQLNRVYGALIAEANRFGGSVVGFSGDAITCWFDDIESLEARDLRLEETSIQASSLKPQVSRAALRAVACALAMQQAMRAFSSLATNVGTIVAMAIKVAVVGGPVRRFLVGDPRIQRIDVLAGRTLDTLAAVEHLAERGEVVLDAATAAGLGDRIDIQGWRAASAHGDSPTPPIDSIAIVKGVCVPVEPAPWPEAPAAIGAKQARPWLLPHVYARLWQGDEQFVSDLRPAAALFLSFGGIDYDRDADADRLLDAYIRHVQSTVARYEGALLQITMGDKGGYLYSAFGAPIAHDDDAIRAVACALELQSPPPHLNVIGDVRIGVARGQMYSGAYGGPTRRTYGVLGDHTNLAARLMSAAAPGEIRCDATVYRYACRRWDFQPLPPMRLKGKAGLIPAYRPAGPRSADDGRRNAKGDEPSSLVGRADEIDRLAAAVVALKAGAGRVLFIEGEAGIGKSRLLAELARLMHEHGLAGLFGAGQSIEQQTPYRAWRDIFSSYFGLDALGGAAERQAQVRRVVQEAAPDQIEHLPLLNDVLGLDMPDTPLTAALDQGLRQERLVGLLTALLRAWARERPLLLVLEDAHWLDSLSWTLALQIARALLGAGEPLLLVLASRPLDELSFAAQKAAALHQLEASETLALATLSAHETIALATARLGLPPGGLPSAVADLVAERAGGNPFFAEELIFTLRDQGLIVIEPEEQIGGADTPIRRLRCRISGDLPSAAAALPDTIQGLILARIDGLSPDRQLMLKAAAVIGHTFAYKLLHHVLRQHTAIGLNSLKAHLGRLVARDLLALNTPDPDLTYLFKHIIIQEVTYQTLLFVQRRALHRTVAEWYETTFGDLEFAPGPGAGARPPATLPPRLAPYVQLLVHHYHHAEDDERERAYALLAAKQLLATSAYRESLVFHRRALALTPDGDPEQISLSINMGEIHMRLGEYAEAKEDLHAALALAREAGDHPSMIYALSHLAHICMTQNGDLEQSEAYLREGLAIARAISDHSALAEILRRLGNIKIVRCDYQPARGLLQESLVAARASSDQLKIALSLNSLSHTAAHLGYFDEALAYSWQVWEIGKRIGNRFVMNSSVMHRGLVSLQRGAYAEAYAQFQEALAMAKQIGERQKIAQYTNYIGSCLVELDRDREALEMYREALRDSMSAEMWVDALGALAGVACVWRKAGRTAAAAELIGLVLRHPACCHEARHVAEPCFEALRRAMAPGAFAAALGRAEQLDFATVAHDILADPWTVSLGGERNMIVAVGGSDSGST